MTFRLIFMGSPEFSVSALAALIEAGHNIACVYSQPPRPAGRGHKETPCPVHTFALDHGLKVRTPVSLKDEATQQAFADLDADVAVVAAYGLILPPAILTAPRHGCLNIHASLLPRWRGAAPIQRAIIAGDLKTGVTIMAMDEGLDTGPMLSAKSVAIGPDTTATTLHDALAGLGATMIVEALAGLQAGTTVPQPQPEDGATYAAKLSRDEGRIDWNLAADDIERRVRALNPWPGIWFEHDGKRIKILAAVTDTVQGGSAGQVLDDEFGIACGQGCLRPTRVQIAGRSAVSADDFLRGYDLPAGTIVT